MINFKKKLKKKLKRIFITILNNNKYQMNQMNQHYDEAYELEEMNQHYDEAYELDDEMDAMIKDNELLIIKLLKENLMLREELVKCGFKKVVK